MIAILENSPVWIPSSVKGSVYPAARTTVSTVSGTIKKILIFVCIVMKASSYYLIKRILVWISLATKASSSIHNSAALFAH